MAMDDGDSLTDEDRPQQRKGTKDRRESHCSWRKAHADKGQVVHLETIRDIADAVSVAVSTGNYDYFVTTAHEALGYIVDVDLDTSKSRKEEVRHESDAVNTHLLLTIISTKYFEKNREKADETITK